MKHLILYSLIFFFSLNFLTAQNDTSPKRTTKIEAGYLFGGTPSYFYLASYYGPTIGIFHGAQLSDRFHLYGGIQLEKLNDRTLFPMGADFDFYNKKGSQFFNFKMGYAFARANRQNNMKTKYDYKGGLYFGMGYGFDLLKKEDWKLTFLVSYNFRDTKLVYDKTLDETQFEDPSKTHLFSVKTIIAF